MSTESFNRTSNDIKTSDISLDVLKQKVTAQQKRKICINHLNKRLHLAQKKDKYKNVAIVSAIFISVGLVGFIAG